MAMISQALYSSQPSPLNQETIRNYWWSGYFQFDFYQNITENLKVKQA